VKNKLHKKGVWISHFTKDFWIREDLSLEAKAIYAIIKCYANNETFEAFPSLPLLCKVTGKNRVTIQKYIKELEGKQCMKKQNERKEDGTYKNNIYTIIESGAEKIYKEEDLTKAKNIAYGKNAYLSKDKIFHSGKTYLITDIYHILNNNISIAQLLVKGFVLNDKECIQKISKLVNKFTSALGEQKLRRIFIYLLGEMLNGREHFNSIDQLGRYLGGCVKKQGKITDSIPEITQGVEQWNL
jgi:hypothetical protein